MPQLATARRPTVARLNHRHRQIVNWLVLNPDKTLGDCARFFGYTQAWLSTLIHSDTFQAEYRQRCREVGAAAVHTINAKLAGTAAATLDAVKERIEQGVASERLLGDTMKTTLQALGYTGGQAASGPELHQHQHLHVDAETLQRARAGLLGASGSQAEVKDAS